jgi:hypothetical protein
VTIGDQVVAYVDALMGVVSMEDLFEAVDALIARDNATRWWEEEA